MPYTYEETESRFLATLGYAITQWANVEDALFKVFAKALCAKDEDLAAAAYYSQINFRSKLDMVDAVIHVKTQGPRLDEWNSLFRRLKKRAAERNILAHNALVHVAEGRPGDVLHLVPKLKPNSNKPADRWAYVMGTKDLDSTKIAKITEQFDVISRDLESYLATMT